MHLKQRQDGLSLWIVLAGLLLISLGGATGWYLLQHKAEPQAEDRPAPTAQTSQPAVTVGPAINSRSVTGADQKVRTPPIDASTEDSTPVTSVDLTLKGVITRQDTRLSRALIAKGKKPEAPYRPGDQILDNVALEAVAADHVVLLVDGRRETLYLNRTLKGSGASTLPNAASGRNTESIPGFTVPPAVIPSPPAPGTAGNIAQPPAPVPEKKQKASGTDTKEDADDGWEDEEDDWDDEEDDWDDEEDDWEDEEDDWEDEEDDWDDEDW